MVKAGFKRLYTVLRAALRLHWHALFLSLICACIIGIPSVGFRFEPAFQGVDLLGTDAEENYVAQIRSVYNGDFSFGNVFLYEGKDEPYLKQPLPAILTAVLGKSLGLSVADASVAAKFFFPVVVFWLVYGLYFTISKRRLLSLLGAVFVLMSPATSALLDPHTWLPLLQTGVFPVNDAQFLLYARTINPQVSSVIFFAYLLALWRLLRAYGKSDNRAAIGIATATLLGASFYTYIYSFTLLLAITGCLGLYFLVCKEWGRFKLVGAITGGGVTIGIPYIINMVEALRSPYYPELAVRAGQLASHAPVISSVWCGIILLLIIFYRRLDSFGLFALSFLGGIFLVSNQQIITGRTIPIPSHFHWYYMAPVAGFLLGYIFISIVQKYLTERVIGLLQLLAIIIFIGVGIQFQRWSYTEHKGEALVVQRYSPALTWLADHTNEDDVIFSEDDFALLALVYTPANNYYNRYIGENLVSSERLRRADYTYMYLNGVQAKDAEAYFADPVNRDLFGRHQFGNYYRAIKGCYDCYPDEYNQQFIREYKEFASQPFIDNLKKYRITYAVQDKKSEHQWNLGRYFSEIVFEDDQVIIYRVP